MDDLDRLRTIVVVLFGCLVILSALLVSTPELDMMCPQHRKPRSQCRDEHRP